MGKSRYLSGTIKWFFVLWLVSVPQFFMKAQTLTSVMNSYRGYDMDSDGIVEINSLDYLPFENRNENINPNSRLVLVFVEDRLLEQLSGGGYTTGDLLKRLEQYKDDLRAEGYFTKFIKADVYNGEQHQDGQTLLSIRNFLKDVKKTWNLQGVVLVGDFPEAMLVRRWIWRSNSNVTIAGTEYKGTDFLRIVPEIVAHRADIVLADLDGKWEDIYVKKPTALESIEALPIRGTASNWPVNGAAFVSTVFNDNTLSFQDFFWIKDDNFQKQTSRNKLTLTLYTTQRHPELSQENRSLPNPIVIPDILVSRINPKHVGVSPDKNFRDMHGRSILNASGKPQTLETAQDKNPISYFEQDRVQERELLIRYFDRNHNYRAGGNPQNSHRTAAVAYGEDLSNATSLNNYLKKASSSFSDPVSFNAASLYNYVQFLKTPATLKGMFAHANEWNTVYGSSYNISDLENIAGRNPWRWKKERNGSNYLYTPSFADQKGTADSYLHRTIYENNVLAETGANLFIHNGCEVNSPSNVARYPYSHKEYGGMFQNAESVLFFLNGVALASRAKVFYDRPEGFTDEIGKDEKKTFGDGWRAYFVKESQDRGLVQNVAGNKRTYTWSLIGDWTVRVKYDNGLGIFKYNSSKIDEVAVHANRAWFEGWNFEAGLNKIEGVGDFNGDGKDDILITSSWGIGVVYREENQWKTLVVQPKDTWFGQWRYNASVNRGNDKIEAIADFDNDGKADILISSSWGIGILKLQGNTFTTIMAQPNGTRFGTWTYNTSTVIDNKIEGVGDFNGDGRADILVSKPYGIALLTLSGNTLNSLVVQPKDTWFGQWRYNASVNKGKDKIEAIADFDKDGKADILISSSWGIGILKLQGNTFTTIMAKANGTRFGTWTYNTSTVIDNKIEGVGDFNGDGRADILVSKPYGIALLTLSGNTLNSLVVKPKDTWFGQWRYNASVNQGSDRVEAIADFDRDGKTDILISSSWGVGILKLSGDTFISLYTNPHGSKIGNWHLQRTNKFPVVGNFDGIAGKEFLIYND
jgi:hypothetical protein